MEVPIQLPYSSASMEESEPPALAFSLPVAPSREVPQESPEPPASMVEVPIQPPNSSASMEESGPPALAEVLLHDAAQGLLQSTLRYLATTDSPEADIQALSALRTAVSGSLHCPSPLAVIALDPEAPLPLSPLQASSVKAWCSGSAITLPTKREALKASRDHLASSTSSHDIESSSLREEASHWAPSAMDPCEMAEHAHKAGWLAFTPATAKVFPQAPAAVPGTLPALNPAGLHACHKSCCLRCTTGSPCYCAAAINYLASASLPWLSEDRPKSSSPVIAPYSASLVKHLRKVVTLGALVPTPKEEIKYFSPVFVAEVYGANVTDSDAASMNVGGPDGAKAVHDASIRAADVFMMAFAKECREAASGYSPTPSSFSTSPDPPLTPASSSSEPSEPLSAPFWPHGYKPSPKQVLAAYRAAEAATCPLLKERLVVALGGLSKHFVDVRLRYARLMEALALTREGYVIVKVDCKAGYYQVPVSPTDQPFLGLAVEVDAEGTVEYFTFARLPMGLGPSAFIFSLFSGIVHDIFRSRCDPSVVSFVYIDDFVLLCKSPELARQARTLLLSIMAECGMSWSAEKTSPVPQDGPLATREDILLGVSVNTASMVVQLPPAKRVRAISSALILLRCAKAGIPVPEDSLAKLAGRLIWASMVEPLIPSHTRAITRNINHGQWRGRWSVWRSAARFWSPGEQLDSFISELGWLVDCSSKGVLVGSRLLGRTHNPLQQIFFASDASGANALALVSEASVLRVHLPDCEGVAIAVLEALALVILLWRYGPSLKGCTIVIASDALGALYWHCSQKARRDDANDLEKLVALACERYDIVLLFKWITRWHNFISDRGCISLEAVSHIQGSPPVRVQLSLSGLPCDFLKPWALSLDPTFSFSVKAWQTPNSRGPTSS